MDGLIDSRMKVIVNKASDNNLIGDDAGNNKAEKFQKLKTMWRSSVNFEDFFGNHYRVIIIGNFISRKESMNTANAPQNFFDEFENRMDVLKQEKQK